jgi:hypothetical protein
MKVFTLLLAWAVFLPLTFAQTILQGKVTDKETGGPLAYATVALFREGKLVTGTETDFDGIYQLSELDSGYYMVEISYTGYGAQKFKAVKIPKGKLTTLNAQLSTEGIMLETIAVTYTKPVIEHDNISSGAILTSEEIRVSPKRSAIKGKGKSAGKSEKAGVEMGKSKGSRDDAPHYFIDGVKVTGKSLPKGSAAPEAAVETAEPLLPAGQLTAGELHDFSKWDLWKDVAEEDLRNWREHWQFQPVERYPVQVMSDQGQPLANAVVHLKKGRETVWTARTDNTGKAELWANAFGKDAAEQAVYEIEVDYKGEKSQMQQAALFQQGINSLKIKAICDNPNVVDVLFVVDATGSMQDEINYLKSELNDVIEKTKTSLPGLQWNLGSVFYRDKGDMYVTRHSDFSTDMAQTTNFIKTQDAGGGGDAPEAVDSALAVAIRQLKWSDEARAKLLFLVLDAPPHEDAATIARMHRLAAEAAAKGIRIIPVTGSGIDKSAEYLMRCLALATNGAYVFLTNHSGIGGDHIEPSTDTYKVELLNKLLQRLIVQFAYMPDCVAVAEDPVWKLFDLPTDPGEPKHRNQAKAYPNPTSGPLTLELKKAAPELFITDLAGKILQQHKGLEKGKVPLDLAYLPNGSYYLKSAHPDNNFALKVMVIH